MAIKENWIPSKLVGLQEDECWELLGQEPVGRVAYCTPEGPVVLPVNFSLDGTDVLFRTSPQSPLARAMHHGRVAFEADGYDSYREAGWSVLVHGDASYDDADVPPENRPEPWAEGHRNLVVRIRPRWISGRRLIG